MALSREMRRLQNKWDQQTGWPQRLDWIEIEKLRGWDGQRFSLSFPIMAVVGENGAGKSTVLQCAAAVYRADPPRTKFRYASDFFPDTTWDHIRNAEIRYLTRQGPVESRKSIRKRTDRWRGNPDRPTRTVEYIDLSRIQPVQARVGYTKLANPLFAEATAQSFETEQLERFSEIMGRPYDLAKMAALAIDAKRLVPVIGQQGSAYSGFHQGAGETTVAELLQNDLPRYSLVLIDEVESSLHPRAQRRLIRDLAEKARENELQVVLTTHSPYVLEELPLQARAYIMLGPSGRREIVYGVSPEFAMSKMDDVPYYEIDLYVEDDRAKALLTEILAAHAPDLVSACQIIPYGAASVGQALGQMVVGGRFPRPTCVYLDGDRAPAPGCLLMPGEDSPERVVFEGLRKSAFKGVDERTGRPYTDVVDYCSQAMTLGDAHDWVRNAAQALVLGGDTFWQAMCAQWATTSLSPAEARRVVEPIRDALLNTGTPTGRVVGLAPAPTPASVSPEEPPSTNAPQLQLEL
jgi:predicted ATPase